MTEVVASDRLTTSRKIAGTEADRRRPLHQLRRLRDRADRPPRLPGLPGCHPPPASPTVRIVSLMGDREGETRGDDRHPIQIRAMPSPAVLPTAPSPVHRCGRFCGQNLHLEE